MKTCSRCKVAQTVENFYQHRLIKSADGRRAMCNGCVNVRKRAQPLTEKRRQTKRAYHEANRQKTNSNARSYRRLNPNKFKNYALIKTFGITIEQYNQMLAEQGATCAICRRPETAILNGKVKALAVDHCHSTGAIRGLLCTKCNPAIGYMDDSPIRLIEAAVYLANFIKKTAR